MVHRLVAAARARASATPFVVLAFAGCLTLVGSNVAAEEAAPQPARPASATSPAPAPKASPLARPEITEVGYLERRWAGTDLTAIAAALATWRRENGDWPADCPGAAVARLSPPPERDPWGSPYACVLDQPPRVVSAGADRQLGSPDDIEYRLDGGGLVPSSAAGAGSPGAAGSAPATLLSADGAAPAPPATEEAKATTDRLVWMARALRAYRDREGHYPVADRAEHLERWLVPDDLPPSQWFDGDGWNHPWRYRVTDTGSSYSLSSAGADGRWDALASVLPAAAVNADGDLLVADGTFIRWPSGFRPENQRGGPAVAQTPEAKEPQDPAARTSWRLERFAARIQGARGASGRYPESDDAPRLAAELGAGAVATDGWGREVDYLSQGGGAHFALVSRGKDGRASRSMEEYARGAPAQGDDIVIRR